MIWEANNVPTKEMGERWGAGLVKKRHVVQKLHFMTERRW